MHEVATLPNCPKEPECLDCRVYMLSRHTCHDAADAILASEGTLCIPPHVCPVHCPTKLPVKVVYINGEVGGAAVRRRQEAVNKGKARIGIQESKASRKSSKHARARAAGSSSSSRETPARQRVPPTKIPSNARQK